MPTSFSGYAIGIVFMILGIIALSLPIGLVATAYRDVSERYDHDFVTTEAHSIKILEMLKEAQEKVTDLEVLLENGLKKFNDRHRKLIVYHKVFFCAIIILAVRDIPEILCL